MPSVSMITEEMLSSLRESLSEEMGGRRLLHTLAVEKEAAALAAIYLPQYIHEIRAAALLHDITKERTRDEQIALCRAFSISLREADLASPKVLHAKTAPGMILARYPAFATPRVLDAVRKHTTGARHMTLFSKLIYLADYIEETRTFDDCVRLRRLFWEPIHGMGRRERLYHLDRILLLSFDMTVRALLSEGAPIALETVEARNSLLQKISKHI